MTPEMTQERFAAIRHMDRRQFVRKAAVAGALVWVTPVIVPLDTAWADAHSAPPSTPPRTITRTDEPRVLDAPVAHTDAESLPYTGEETKREAERAAAVAALGAAVVALTRTPRSIA